MRKYKQCRTVGGVVHVSTTHTHTHSSTLKNKHRFTSLLTPPLQQAQSIHKSFLLAPAIPTDLITFSSSVKEARLVNYDYFFNTPYQSITQGGEGEGMECQAA